MQVLRDTGETIQHSRIVIATKILISTQILIATKIVISAVYITAQPERSGVGERGGDNFFLRHNRPVETHIVCGRS